MICWRLRASRAVPLSCCSRAKLQSHRNPATLRRVSELREHTRKLVAAPLEAIRTYFARGVRRQLMPAAGARTVLLGVFTAWSALHGFGARRVGGQRRTHVHASAAPTAPHEPARGALHAGVPSAAPVVDEHVGAEALLSSMLGAHSHSHSQQEQEQERGADDGGLQLFVAARTASRADEDDDTVWGEEDAASPEVGQLLDFEDEPDEDEEERNSTSPTADATPRFDEDHVRWRTHASAASFVPRRRMETTHARKGAVLDENGSRHNNIDMLNVARVHLPRSAGSKSQAGHCALGTKRAWPRRPMSSTP